MSGFISYIGGISDEEKDVSPPVTPDLLPGEMVISSAGSVCCFTTASGITSGQSGSMFVTTLKLAFKLHVQENETPTHNNNRNNKILSDTDITLSSIHSIYEVTGEGTERKKKLTLGSNVTNKVDGLFIICKNFKFFRFSFKFSGVNQGRQITNALLHHSRPKKNELLFAFEHSLYQRPDYLHSTVWGDVLSGTTAPGHRISRYNETWQLCSSLPQEFVVPGHVTDSQLVSLAAVGQGSRPPVWVWGTRQGGAIYIQPALAVLPSPSILSMPDNYYKREVNIVDLDKILPQQQMMEESFVSMLSLHCVDSAEKFQELDMKYLSLLEVAGWLALVAAVLKVAGEVAEEVARGQAVVLQEGESRNTSILVASVAQMLMEPEFRTRPGFEHLVQNNWVSLGFPFSRSHALSGAGGGAVLNCNPVFLLFLDCVHQISVQFPSSLEFTEEYLITVWDTALLPVFDTFIFDCEHDRAVARSSPETPIQLHSAWEWEQQYSGEHVKTWDNPLYGIPLRPPRRSPSDPAEASMMMDHIVKQSYSDSKKYLPILCDVASLSVWYRLFNRSVPGLQVKNSGEDQITAVRVEAKKTVVSCVNYRSSHPGNNRTH